MKKILLVLLTLFILVAAAACAMDIVYAEPSVVSIAISGIKKVDDYIVGDVIDISGAFLVVTYNNGNIEEVPMEYSMLDSVNINMSLPEEGKKIVVNYKGVSTHFFITVLDIDFQSVSLVSLPHKLVYIEGEQVSPDGAYIGVNYSGGKTVKVAVKAKMLQNYNNTALGEQDILISYFGRTLSFAVNFLPKTVKSVVVTSEPLQNSVFQYFGSTLKLDGMKLKLFYDNGLAPEVLVTDISNSVRIYLDDSDVKTVIAKVAYLPTDYFREVVYEYLGNALVEVGDYVHPDLALASNVVLDDSFSKTYGRVISIAENKVIVDTVVDYFVTGAEVKAGQIVMDGEVLGRYGSNTVFCSGGGLVTSVVGGKVTIQTAPTSSFKINVKGRNFQSMEVLTYPKTNINQTDTRTQSIIQGDTLDLKTGKVRVNYDNGEHVDLTMDSTLIRVINSADDMQRNEISNLTFNQINDVEGLGEGRYQLLYDIEHTYGDSGITVVVTVIDEDGKDIYVQENRYVSLNLGKNYTVSIRVSRTSEGETRVSERSYYLSTIGAGVRHKQLDISAAGRHSLMAVYGGVETNFVKFTVSVAQKTPVKLILDAETDNISNQQFYKGETIKLDTLNYRIEYDNGDLSDWTGVTLGMLGEGCTLFCDTITTSENPKIIFFTIIGSTHIKSPDLYCYVAPEPIISVSFATLPDNLFLTATAGGGNDIDLSGGVISIFYKNNRVVTIGDKPGESLSSLINAPLNQSRIVLSYEPIGGGEIPSTAYTPQEIYSGAAEAYVATVTYYDAYGATQTTYLDYYIYYIPGATKSVEKITADYRVGQYKQEYIQSEDWDFEGIKLIVTYTDGTTSTISPTVDMVYKSTTNNIGRGIPLQFNYLGKVYSGALSIDVSKKIEQTITVIQDGKNTYFTTDRGIDLSGYRFNVGYNAGPYELVLGVTTFTGSWSSVGWWYQLTDLEGKTTVLNREGKKIIKLYHTTKIDDSYHTVLCDINIEVFVNNSPVASIAYIPEAADSFYNMTHNGLPILAEVAAGWEIMFSDYDTVNNLVFKKMLTLNYQDGTTGYVEFSNTMLSYNKSDHTQGYRKIVISYKGAVCEVNILVNNSNLHAIEVYRKPVTNYIAGSQLNLSGGILKLIFKGEHVTMEKYIDMDNDDVYIAGYNANISSEIDHQEQTISLTYKGKNTSYNIIVYNKQHVVFKYQNTIFFYGRTSAASVQAFRAVPEFVLPSTSDINMYYISSEYFLEDWAAAVLYLQANPSRAIDNIMQIIVGYNEDGSAIYNYVDEIFAKTERPYAPATRGYDYFILMTVNGNVYYKDANYCIKKYTVIPKVIVVSSIEASPYAYIYRIKTENVAATVEYLFYFDFSSVRSEFSQYTYITGLEMVSPNKNYIEILLSVNTTYVEDGASYQVIKNVFARVKFFIEQNVVINKHLPEEEQVNVNVSNYDTVSVDGITRGVNISEFEGGKPSFISYRIDKGETLTLGGVMDLLENSLDLVVVDNYYNLGTYRTKTGTLSHNNYNIDFSGSNYTINRRIISGYMFNQGSVSGSFENSNLTLTLTGNQKVSLTVMYVNGINGKTSDTISSTDYKVSYYKEGLLLDSVPTEAGTYQVEIIDCYANTLGNLSLNFTLIIS